MSKAYQFPQNEPNPFADAQASPGTANNNPYAASAAARTQPEPGAYEALPHRGTMLLTMGVLSLLGGVLAIALLWFYLPFIGLTNLALAIPTWSMARHDLIGMRLGAVNETGRSATRAGWAMALVGIVLTLVSTGVIFLIA